MVSAGCPRSSVSTTARGALAGECARMTTPDRQTPYAGDATRYTRRSSRPPAINPQPCFARGPLFASLIAAAGLPVHFRTRTVCVQTLAIGPRTLGHSNPVPGGATARPDLGRASRLPSHVRGGL
jgi:hypothetical protein